MKQATQHPSAIRSTGGTAQAFTIATSPKAFDVLSKGIYTDHITAVLRELGTNAADSLVEAGKPDVPFVVHLPNDLEKYLQVTDEGLGMSDAEVRGYWHHADGSCPTTLSYDDGPAVCPDCGKILDLKGGVYTTYFESPKTDSNDVTGCLGLGAKTPFAYGGQFSLVTIKDGWRWVYLLAISDGVPTISLTAASETDEGNGVSVTMPVLEKDFIEFTRKAQTVFRWFGHPQSTYRVRPSVVGNPSFQWPDEPRWTVKTQNLQVFWDPKQVWSRYSHGGYSSTNAKLVAGNVAYPIRREELPRHDEWLRFLVDHGAIFFSSMRDEQDRAVLEPAANRESLQWTQQTREMLSAAATTVLEELSREFRETLDKQPNIWKARLLVEARTRGNTIQANLTRRLQNRGLAQYHGQPIDETSIAVYNHQTGERKARVMLYRPSQTKERYTGKPTSLVLDRDNTHVPIVSGLHAWINDLGEEGRRRFRRYVLDNGFKSEHYVLLEEHKQYDFQQFLKWSGLDVIAQYASELPELPKVARAKPSQVCLFCLDSTTLPDYWSRLESLPMTGHTYVELKGHEWKLPGASDWWHCPRSLAEQVHGQLDPMGFNSKIYGVRTAAIKHLDESWTPLDKAIVEHLRKLATYRGMAQQAQVYFELHRRRNWVDQIPALAPFIPKDHTWGPLVKHVQDLHIASRTKEAATYYPNATRLQQQDVVLPSPFPDDKAVDPLLAQLDKFRDAHPLLRDLWRNYASPKPEDVAEYILLKSAKDAAESSDSPALVAV